MLSNSVAIDWDLVAETLTKNMLTQNCKSLQKANVFKNLITEPNFVEFLLLTLLQRT